MKECGLWVNLKYCRRKHMCWVIFCRTLYCAKGNYEFGISRVIKSLEPYQKKLGTDTWFYTKRCFLSLIENMSKHMIMLRDNVIMECIQFLEHCECKPEVLSMFLTVFQSVQVCDVIIHCVVVYGKDVKISNALELDTEPMHPGKNTVTYEARQLKALMLQLI